jgi:hypothetical protein
MFRLEIGCWFVCLSEGVTDIIQILSLNEHPVLDFELPALID